MPAVLFVKEYLKGLVDNFVPRRKHLAALRSRWGQPGNGEGVLASFYFDMSRDDCADTYVDDNTWDGLELAKIFARVDTTVAAPGRQVLYRQLRTCVDDPSVLSERFAGYAWLRKHRDVRERIQLCLATLDRDGSAHMPRYLLGEIPGPGKYRWLFVPTLAINFGISAMCLESLRWKMKILQRCMELIGVSERLAAIAVASWLESVGGHCRPEWSGDRRLAVVEGRHPLIDHGVGNSICVDDKSVLVTGSNMAGKTTFIKMVGINLILGRTLGVCLATSATVPWTMRLMEEGRMINPATHVRQKPDAARVVFDPQLATAVTPRA